MTGLVVAKVTLVLMLASFALSIMRRSSASVRHVVVVAALTSALTIPALELVLPSWRVLPRSEKVVMASATTEQLEPPASLIVTHAEAPIAAATTGQIDLNQLLLLSWGIGFAGLLMLLFGQVAAMQHAVRRADILGAPEWTRITNETCRALGIREYVEVRLRPAHTMPAVWGFRRPIVLLPRDCLGWSDERRRAVLAHEFAHIARRDTLTLVIGQLACALHWFNPLVWMLRNRLAAEREQACDDLAISQGIPPSCYADHLLTTAADYRQQRSFAPVMAARSQLERRIMAIFDTDRSRYSVPVSLQLAFAAMVASALVPLSSLSWADEDNRSHDASAQAAAESDSATFNHHLRAMGIKENDTNALMSGLNAQSPLTRASSAWALGNTNDPIVIDPLIQAGYDADARVRQWSIRSLARWDIPRVVDMLIARLNDSDAEVRQWAVRALDSQDTPAVSEWLISKLDDPDAEVREWAVRGLLSTRDDRTTESLIAMLQDDDSEVREWSARSLGYCGNERAIGALQTLRDDPDEDVREWASRALDEIECQQARTQRVIRSGFAPSQADPRSGALRRS